MANSYRSFLSVVVLAVLLGGLALLWWLFGAAVTAPLVGLVAELGKRDELEHRTQTLAHRNRLKGLVVQSLIAEEITLSEAVERFQQALEETSLGEIDLPSAELEDAPDYEIAANVVAWVSREVEFNPRAGVVLPDLIEDYAQRYGRPYVERHDGLLPDRPRRKVLP